METGITFKADELLLEGLLHRSSSEYGVVITHPHPQYGGNMYNDIVAVATSVYASRGFSTFRFNFRGVGASSGSFGDGVGEVKDVLAALAFLKLSGISRLHLVGYSFGAWVNGLIEKLPDGVVSEIALSPPVTFLDYSGMSSRSQLSYIITGDRDQFSDPAQIEGYRERVNPEARLDFIENCDHFYSGHGDRLEALLDSFLLKLS